MMPPDNHAAKISVVTPTLHRPREIGELLDNLNTQSHLPYEVILVDGAPAGVNETESNVEKAIGNYPFDIKYIRHGGGTAIQRNVGIEEARGDFIAFIDDDIRLEKDFFEKIMEVYACDTERAVGGVAGYISNQYLDPEKSSRWKWYRRLRLFKTYVPGRYDYETGYPINRYLQPPHDGIREIDFMGTNCGVWRMEVFDEGLRFDEFFVGFGILEDAHFALRAKGRRKLLEYGSARCIHLHSSSGRENPRLIAKKTAVNYRYVYLDIVHNRTFVNEYRFWRLQVFDLMRFTVYAVIKRDKGVWETVLGKVEGIFAALRLHVCRDPLAKR